MTVYKHLTPGDQAESQPHRFALYLPARKKRKEKKRKGKNRTEQNRTEQNRTEQNRTEQNRTEQNRTEQNRTEQLAKPNYKVKLSSVNPGILHPDFGRRVRASWMQLRIMCSGL